MELIKHKSGLMFFILLVLTLFIPLYPKFPLLDVSGTFVAIRLEDILIAIAGVIVVAMNFKRIPWLVKQPITQAFLLFWGIGLISLLSAIFLTHTVQTNVGLLHYLRRIEYMSLFFVGWLAIKNLHQVKTLLLAMMVATVFIVIYGLGQVYAEFPVISTTNKEFSKGLILALTPGARPNSTFAGHYDLAAYLSMALIFLGTLFFVYGFKQLKASHRKVVAPLTIAAVALMSFGMLGLTAARASFASTFFGLALSFWLLKKKWLILGLVILSVVAVAAIPQLRHRLVATITVNLLEGGGPKYQADPNVVNEFTPMAHNATDSGRKRITDIPPEATMTTESTKTGVASDIAEGEPTDYTELTVSRSYNIRTDVEWPRAMRAFYKNPLLGTGYSSITDATDNDFLRSLGEVGILGSVALALIFFLLIFSFIKAMKRGTTFEKLFLIGAICATINILITAVFIDVLEASKIACLLWIMLGVSWAVATGYKNK
jgi:hypothetical protein